MNMLDQPPLASMTQEQISRSYEQAAGDLANICDGLRGCSPEKKEDWHKKQVNAFRRVARHFGPIAQHDQAKAARLCSVAVRRAIGTPMASSLSRAWAVLQKKAGPLPTEQKEHLEELYRNAYAQAGGMINEQKDPFLTALRQAPTRTLSC